MKRKFSYYAACWAILLAVFQVICFVTPDSGNKYDAAFWVGYGFITLAFFGQLGCAYVAFKAENARKFFYRLPLITVSYIGLIVMGVVGGIGMALPMIPYYIAVILCLLVLAFTAIAVIKATAAADIVEQVGEKVKTDTRFMKMTTVQAENLLASAQSEPVKTACKKVYEALRYSDPMSDGALTSAEAKITLKMEEFAAAVQEDKSEAATALADAVAALLKERNNLCKALKNG